MSSRVRITRALTGVCVSIIMVSCLAGIAGADLVTYVDANSNSGTEWISVKNSVTGAVTTENVYTGPYTLQVGSPVNSFWMCFDASVSVGAPWSATVFTGPGGDIKSEMIAYLAGLWKPNSTQYDLKVIQLAMWEVTADYATSNLDVTSGNFSLSYASTETELAGDVNRLLGTLLDKVKDREYIATFLIPEVSGSTQPFVQPVPEPGTLLLLGSGLAGLGALGWRRRRRG